MNKKKFVLIFGILLFILSSIILLINGKKYTVKIEIPKDIESIELLEVKLEQETEVVREIDKKMNKGMLELSFESIQPGKTGIVISYKNYYGDSDYYDYHTLYVHNFGIITYDNYFGDSRGDRIIPISLCLFLLVCIYFLIKEYKKNINENIYQYKNILYLSIIIFLSFLFLSQIIEAIHYVGFIGTLNNIISSIHLFSFVVLPIAFITSIFVTVSNIILIKKEGITWRNMLGFLLGLFFCFLTIFPDILNEFLQRSTVIDVHNMKGFASHLQILVECLIYGMVSYLECVLLGTIVLGIKAAKRIPEFNKDFMIILGCKVKKDGTLTPLLQSRVDRALEFRNMQKETTGKDLIFIPSGGKGEDEVISEAEAMKTYLLEKGIEEKNILIEDNSTNTYQNIKFSNKIILREKKNSNIAFSTTNYHVFRAGILATSLNVKVEGIGAKTKSYFWINAFIREFIASLNFEKKSHIKIILILLFITIVMVGIVYLSNNL